MGPTPKTSWECVVVSSTDFSSVMARVKKYKEFTVSKVLSDVGGGTVSLPLDDPALGAPLPPGISVTRNVAVTDVYTDLLNRIDVIANYRGPGVVTNAQSQIVDLGSTSQYLRGKFVTGGSGNGRFYLWYTSTSSCVFIDTNRGPADGYGGVYLNNGGTVTLIDTFNNGFGGGSTYIFSIEYNPLTGVGHLVVGPAGNGVPAFDTVNATFTIGSGAWAGFTPGTKVGWDSSITSVGAVAGHGGSIDIGTSEVTNLGWPADLLLYGQSAGQLSLGTFPGIGDVWDDLSDHPTTPVGAGMELYDEMFIPVWSPWVHRATGGYVIVDPSVADGTLQLEVGNIDGDVGLVGPGVYLRVNAAGAGLLFYIQQEHVYLSLPSGAGVSSYVNAAGTWAAGGVSTGDAWATGDLLKVVYVGNNYKIYRNGVYLGAANTTGWSTTESRCGFFASYSGSTRGTGYEQRTTNLTNWYRSYSSLRNPTFIGAAVVPVSVTPTNILEDDNLWRFYEDGSLKFEFIGELVEEEVIKEDETKIVKVSGRGVAAVLEWGRVFPPGWPASTKTDQKFTNAPVMEVWLALLGQCQARGTLDFVTCSFSMTQDSDGVAWLDLNNYTVSPGDDMLSLLKTYCEQIGADWQMRSGFILDVRQTWGVHKEDLVQFWPGDEIIQQGRSRDRRTIANYVAIKTGDKTATFSEGFDTGSIGRYHRRELYLEASDAEGKAQGSVLAAAAIRVNKQEIKSLTIEVNPDEPKAEMLVDYTIGDWVHIHTDDNYLAGAYRVQSASVSITEDEDFTGELVVASKRELRMAQLMRRLDNLNAGGNGSTPSKPASGSKAISSLSLGDLADVSVVSLATDTYLKWDGAKWKPAFITAVATRLDDLTNVNLTSPTNGSVLKYDTASAKWIDSPASTVGHTVRDEGTALTQRAGLNFVGAGVTAADNAGADRTDVTIPGAPVIYDETTALTVRSKLAFQGAGVTATDDSGNSQTVVTIPNYVPTGGTIGQVLMKTGSGDYAVAWQDLPP